MTQLVPFSSGIVALSGLGRHPKPGVKQRRCHALRQRGPSGVIGTNKACSAETVDAIVFDYFAGLLSHRDGTPPAIADSFG